MHLHLVAGFLGSGKTTAIIGACKYLLAQGKRVGVITNDQGKYLVDSMFVRLENVPSVQVSGGCFCCHYNDLEAQLSLLRDHVQPDAIFAESVGSCADLVATVVRPLLNLSHSGMKPTSFSVLADARLLHRRLLDLPMPFSESIVYLFDQQLEEASLLVINKIDLLTPEQREEIDHLARSRFPDTKIRLQNSLDPTSIAEWVEIISHNDLILPTRKHEIDYQRYGDAESRLAWFDQEVLWSVREGQGRPIVVMMIQSILEGIRARGWGIGHLKFVARAEEGEAKISIPSLEEPGWADRIPSLRGRIISVLINARIEGDAKALQQVIRQAIAKTASASGTTFVEGETSVFHPPPPHPVHRME